LCQVSSKSFKSYRAEGKLLTDRQTDTEATSLRGYNNVLHDIVHSPLWST